MTQFQHGGDILQFASRIKCPVEEVIDLSSNINFIQPKTNIDFNHLNISNYPNYDKLYSSIATLYGVNTNQIELFNGGSSAIFSLFRFFNLQTSVIYSPAYLEYKKASELFNYRTTTINRFGKLEQKVPTNSLVIFVNPSTPDGKFYNIEKLIQRWIEQKCTILIDESFLDFTNFQSAIQYINQYDKLYILKSMTKFYSSAGIRVGTILSNSNNIKRLKKQEPLWKISDFDSHYLQTVLKDQKFPKISKEINQQNRAYLVDMLKASKHIKTLFPSSANYILVQLNNLTAKEFQELLIPYKIMIRDCSNFDFLDEQYVRIAVKSKKALKVLEEALKDNL